jgi:hypothetical protein
VEESPSITIREQEGAVNAGSMTEQKVETYPLRLVRLERRTNGITGSFAQKRSYTREKPNPIRPKISGMRIL